MAISSAISIDQQAVTAIRLGVSVSSAAHVYTSPLPYCHTASLLVFRLTKQDVLWLVKKDSEVENEGIGADSAKD